MAEEPSTERLVRYRAEDLPPVDPDEIARLKAMSDSDIDFSDIPPLRFDLPESQAEAMICLNLDRATIDALRRRRATSQEIREVLRKHFEERSDAA